MTLLFIYLAIAIGVSFLCSILEAVLLSVTPSFVKQTQSDRPHAGRMLNHVKWQKLRGPEPTAPLAQALWSVTPPLADLVIDLYAAGDARLDEILPAHNLAKGFALLVIAEIERGSEAGVHIAHEPMMAFETVPPRESWLELEN